MQNTHPRNDNAHGQVGEVGTAGTSTHALSLPSPQTVKGRVLGALLLGERLTHLDCWRSFGSARLSHHIYVLRGLGWNILIDEVTVPTSDAGRPALIGYYSLPAEAIAEAGERGQQYAAKCARVAVERRGYVCQ